MSNNGVSAKLVSVMVGSAVSVAAIVGLPLGVTSGTVVEGLVFASIVSFVAAIFGAFIGLPSIMFVDRLLPAYRLRHIFIAPFCSVFAWLAIEGAFSRDGWHRIWSSSGFWIDWAPRRMVAVVIIGLLAGGVYTVIWPRFCVIFAGKFDPKNTSSD